MKATSQQLFQQAFAANPKSYTCHSPAGVAEHHRPGVETANLEQLACVKHVGSILLDQFVDDSAKMICTRGVPQFGSFDAAAMGVASPKLVGV